MCILGCILFWGALARFLTWWFFLLVMGNTSHIFSPPNVSFHVDNGWFGDHSLLIIQR